MNVSPPKLAGEEKLLPLNDPAVEPEIVISTAWAEDIVPATRAQERREFAFMGFMGFLGGGALPYGATLR